MANMRKMKQIKKWTFPPSVKFDKNGNLAEPWTVVKWEDGTYSCNCPIWCQLRQPDSNGNRSCKHLRGVLISENIPLGTIDLEAKTSQKTKLVIHKPTPVPVLKPKGRRIILEED